MRDGGVDSHAEAAARERLDLLREGQLPGDLGSGQRFGVELIPGPTSRLGGDRLREVVLGPRGLPREELLAEVVDPASEAAVELRGGDELLLGHRPGQRPAVELVARRRLAAALEHELDPLALGPAVRAAEQSAFARELHRIAAGRDHERLAGHQAGANAEAHIPRGPDERVGQASRVEAPAGRERPVRVGGDHRGAETLEPVERVVQTLPDQAL